LSPPVSWFSFLARLYRQAEELLVEQRCRQKVYVHSVYPGKIIPPKKWKKERGKRSNSNFASYVCRILSPNTKTVIMKNVQLFLLLGGLFFFASPAMQAQGWSSAENDADAPETKDVVDIALSSDAHTTLVAALKAADLVSTLQGDGPFTIFAPTNSAFEALPEGTVATLLKPENKATLTNILTYHVVSGNLDAKKVLNAIKMGNGNAELTALNGGTLKAYLKDGKVYLEDEKGGTSVVSATDLKGDNGVIHVVESVLMPK
jgi:uncharacterized surface protein with fasciclin (FAS1) repeats